MIINAANLDLAFRGFQTVYDEARLAAPSHAMEIAMAVPSSARDETYGWLGAFPQLREWVGPRQVKNLTARGFTIENRKFESTVSVSRADIADDRLGVFKPMFSEMGTIAARHPDELVFGLLKAGFDSPCFDGQNFFDADHPLEDAKGAPVTVSNMQAGAGPGWYLLDVSRGVRPIIWPEREGYEFTSVNRHDDAHVFTHDACMYGVRDAG
jgi:phage major head subunit gpT-like protein